MKTTCSALIALITLNLPLLQSCGEKNEGLPDTLHTDGYNETEMDEAMANARGSIAVFQQVLASGTGENHAVKVAIEDGDDTEHFWLVDVSEIEGGFRGTLNNEPGIVSNVSLGDEVDAIGDAISDWMYIHENQMHGNYTLRVLLPNMEGEEAEFYRSKLAPLPN
ncbi:MAG: DUF2314 domain-containing protein [Verrucomicrobiota bacterium]